MSSDSVGNLLKVAAVMVCCFALATGNFLRESP